MKPEYRKIGETEYILTRKKVKNINLHIDKNGSVCVSAPKFVPVYEIDSFIMRKSQWISDAKIRMNAKNSEMEKPCPFTKEEAIKIFTDYSDKIFPLFANILDNKRPIIKVRNMKTRWGVCAISKRTITFNLQLLNKPQIAQEYVVMHEYVHFLHADHSKAFYEALTKFMPDYKQRRALLK